MSISFSGLASGLDTSSWVESLTALKRAKVETYQAEKEKLVLTQQTLASIKNFFNSFRSVVEKVTDSRFGIGGSLDLFAQNLAVSSKPNILTATANSEAQEGVYNIDVKNLATNTQASSNYSYITTQTVTATATMGSTLTSLGVKAGKIGVTVNGIERNIKLGNDETIQSFIEKLGSAGVNANYNEESGIFNLNISTNAIRDIDNTGIVNALHLKGVNEGYTGNFQTSITETVVEQATLSTKLSELGIKSGNITVGSNSQNTTTLYINASSTIQGLIDSFKSKGYNIGMTDDGCISLTDAYIKNDGTTGLLKALGWDSSDVSHSSQSSNRLQYSTTLVESTVADRNTLLKNIADVNNGDTIIVKNGSNVTNTITLSQTSTIGNVLDSLNSAGLYATMSNDGVVSISDGSIIGGTFDITSAFNLTERVNGSNATSKPIYINKFVAQDITSTENITYTDARDVQLTDKIKDAVPNFNKTIDIHYSDGTILTSALLNDDITFEGLFNSLSSYGIQGKLENGVITLSSDTGYYVSGLEALGIGVASNSSSSTVTVATTRTSSTLYYTRTIAATLSDKICDFIDMDETTDVNARICSTAGVYDQNGNTKGVIYAFSGCTKTGATVSAATTFGDLKNSLASYGITMTMNNGVISLSSNNGNYISGRLATKLGISTVSTVSTKTTGAEFSSSTTVTYTQTIVEGSTKTIHTPGTISPKGIDVSSSSAITCTYLVHNNQTSNAPEYKSINLTSGYMYEYFQLAQELYNSYNNTHNENSAETLAIAKRCYITIQVYNTTGSPTYYTIKPEDFGGVENFCRATISEVINKIENKTGNRVHGSVTNGKLKLYNSENQQIYFLNTMMNIQEKDASGSAIYITSTKQVGTKTVTTTTTTTKTGILTGDIKWGDLTNYNDLDLTFTMRNADTGATQSFDLHAIGTSDATIDSIFVSIFGNFGYSKARIENGYLKLVKNTSSPWYLEEMGQSMQDFFRIKVGEGNSYTASGSSTETVTEMTTTVTTRTIDTSTRFEQLGLNGIYYITVVNKGTTSTLTIRSNDTLGKLITDLAFYDISAETIKRYYDNTGKEVYSTKGMFSVKESEDSYILSMDEDLRNILKIGSAKTYTTTETTGTKNVSSSVPITRLESSTVTALSTIESKYAGNITLYNNGNIVNINTADRQYASVFSQLGYYGFNVGFRNGVVTFDKSSKENVYILDFGGAFGLYGKGYTTSVQTTGTSHNTPSNKLQKDETINANWDTKISQINSAYAGGSIVVQNSSNGSATITFDKTDTLRDVREKLAIYGIAMDLSGGKVTLSGTNDAYIKTIDNNMKSLFKLSSDPTYTTIKTAITDEDRNCSLSSLIADNNLIIANLPANIYVYHNGNRNAIQLERTDTLETLASKLSQYGISMNINGGKLNFTSTGNVYLSGADSKSNFALYRLGIEESKWQHNTSYQSSSPIGVSSSSSQTNAAERDTKLSNLGITTGEYLLYKNGVKYTMFISSDDTLGDFLNNLRSFGIEASLVKQGNYSTIQTSANGDTYITDSNTADKSNIVEKLFGGTNVVQSTNYSGNPELTKTNTSIINATEDTKLAELTYPNLSGVSNYKLQINLNNENITMNINPQVETIGSLIDKFRALGLDASFADGKMVINSGYNSLKIVEPSSTPMFTYNADLGGYSATDANRPIISTEVIIEEKHNSAANYANDNTKLELLNISDGTLTIYRNGEKATINIDSKQTFKDLRSKISAKFSDVNLTFENGYLVIGSNNAEIIVGTTTDSSNFAAITGMQADENKNSKSSRALYCVNNSSKVTTSGLFVRGNVTEGNFKVGNATINIDKNTTIDDIISQINYNDASNATAYWDSIDGKFVIKAKNTGASLINIEAGTSNFTNILGLTYVENGTKRMNIDAQSLGENAKFTINGTYFTSTSNTVTSDVSRIQGVTLNLKDISNEETVTLKIEKDSETAATAVSDIVDAYNELIENIDKEVARGASLDKESTLKLIRNQIRTLMTSSLANTGTYKNLASVGISLSAASSGNIRTDNINALSFDKDKFISSFKGDVSSLKKLLVGTEDTKGILTQVEDVLEQALGGVTGYFASAEKSYNTKISRLDEKIEKANKAADRYKMRLEAKFKSMDMLISKYQNNYSSFLGK